MAEPSHEPADELLIRIWRVLSRVAVPVMMAMAYTLLVATSDVEAKGAFWMGFGFVLVMIAWVVFRKLTDAAALTRALSVGDVAKLEELGKRPQPKYRVARALAALLRGDLEAAKRESDDVQLPRELAVLAAVIWLAAALELPTVRGDKVDIATGHGGFAIGNLAAGMLAARGSLMPAEPDRATARVEADKHLTRVIDDVRAGAVLRAIAHRYLALMAEYAHDAASAATHRRAVESLAAPEATWLRS